jgi:hypothetical protein
MIEEPIDPRLRDYAVRAWAFSHNDLSRAVEMLREWTDVSLELALAALKEARDRGD